MDQLTPEQKQAVMMQAQNEQLANDLRTALQMQSEADSRRVQMETQASENLAQLTQFQQELDRRTEQFRAATQQMWAATFPHWLAARA